MKKKALLSLLVTIIATSILFSGCGNKKTETTPVTEETVAEVEPTKPEDVEPVEEEHLDETNQEASYSTDIIIDGEIVEGTALTQAEIDELKATAPTDDAKYNVERYEAIINNGSFTNKAGNTYTKVVGKPDGSWRRMTDEEAEAIIAKGESAEGYYAAEAELNWASWYWNEPTTNTIYFDYYFYLEEIARPAIEKQQEEELEECRVQLEKMLEDPEPFIEFSEGTGNSKMYMPKEVEQLEIWDTLPEEIKAIIELY